MIAPLYKQILVFACAFLIVSCKSDVKEVQAENEIESNAVTIDQKQFETSGFELGKVGKRSFRKTIHTTGAIHIPERSKASVSTLMSGTIGAVQLTEGQWVSKGQSLFSVTNPELINLQEEYLVAHGQLEYLTEEYKRQQDLANENLTTKKDLLKAKSALSTTRARHGALQKKLKLYGISTESLGVDNLVSSLSVRAPRSGYVSRIHAMQGQYIDPNQTAVTIQSTDQMYLELTVLERDALLLKKGQVVEFVLQGNSNEKHVATIELISKLINEQHMITVNCKINAGNKAFVPGMYANAEIVLQGYEGDALPESAAVKLGDSYYGLRLLEKQVGVLSFEQDLLEIGLVQNGYVEVLKPVNPTAEYLTKGAYFLLQ